VTSDITSFERWLSDATRGLSAESAARVREEIHQHCDSAREAGSDAVDVMRALGDPRAANRAYRKVLLTEQEALLAPALTQPKRPSFQRMLLSATMLSAFVWWLSGKQHGPGFWPVTIAVFCAIPFGWAFPPTTLERSRIHVYVTGVRILLLVGIFGWYWNWIGALSVGAVIFWQEYFFTYRRLSIFRKLAAGQTWSLLPEEPELTHLEAIHLNTLRKGSPYENVSVTVLFLMLMGMAAWQPGTFAPMTAWMIAGFLARRTLPIYTEERSRRFRIAKWTAMAVAAVLPPLYGARVPWIGAAELAFFFYVFDMKSISLRRKLPVAEWPKRLYW
jgi:hypothetical protein